MWVLGWRLVSAAALCTPDPDRAAFLLLGTFTALQMCAGSSVAAERQGSGIPRLIGLWGRMPWWLF